MGGEGIEPIESGGAEWDKEEYGGTGEALILDIFRWGSRSFDCMREALIIFEDPSPLSVQVLASEEECEGKKDRLRDMVQIV